MSPNQHTFHVSVQYSSTNFGFLTFNLTILVPCEQFLSYLETPVCRLIAFGLPEGQTDSSTGMAIEISAN